MDRHGLRPRDDVHFPVIASAARQSMDRHGLRPRDDGWGCLRPRDDAHFPVISSAAKQSTDHFTSKSTRWGVWKVAPSGVMKESNFSRTAAYSSGDRLWSVWVTWIMRVSN